MSTAADPLINVRAKTQLVSEGISRYMGEQWQMPLREGLGLIGEGEAEQWIDPTRPLVWAQNAPGPHEAWQQYGDPQTQGSREGAIGGGPAGPRGGTAGDQQTRQIAGQNLATNLQPQQYDDYRSPSTAGLQGPTDQWWQEGATEGTGGATPGPISPARPGAQAGQLTTQMPGKPSSSRHGPPAARRPPISRPPMPPHERRDERGDREAHHERREERYDKRHEARDDRRETRHERKRREAARGDREAHHERRDERYDKRHEARDDRREAPHARRDERGDRDRRESEGRRHHR